MKRLNSRETLILIITIGLVVLFIGYQFVIQPMHEGSVDINDQLRVDRERLIKARHMVSQRGQIEAMYQNLAGLIGMANSEKTQVPAIISQIESAARENNIHIGNIQPQKPVTEKETVFLGVELEIDGQWLDIVRFLDVLQQRPNFYFINELNLEKYSNTVNSLRGRIVISCMCLINPQ